MALVLVGCSSEGAAPGASSRYFLVGARGATSLDTAAARSGRRLLPGFGVAIVEERLAAGRRVGRTGQGRWIPMADLTAAIPAPFSGVPLAPGAGLDVAWVVTPDAPVLVAGRRAGTRPLFARETVAGCDGDLCRTGLGTMAARDLRIPRAAPRPPGVGPTERWLDVHLPSQTLVAYEGDRPVFTTLVSTGLGAPGTTFATPEGVFRVRSKHLASTMDNLEHTGVVPYSYEDIPLVQYFTERVALHAALWHQRFGHPASHGCINLTPADAERLFAFTAPHLPAGDREVWTRPGDSATVVRVRR